jgi:adenylate cyclase
MFADVAGFTEFAQSDERGALGLLDELEGIVRPILARHHGREVKTMGDGLLAEFPDALDAVECAVDLQRAIEDRNREPGVRPLRLRIGLHLGDVERRGSDIVGDAVNVAARVEPLAEPGGVSLSEHVEAQVRNKVAYRLDKLGTRSLKGVRDPIGIYRVALPWAPGGAPPTTTGGPPRLAVLPLANISPDPKDEYFADGLTEELITGLSRLHSLRVIARTSVSQYKATSKSVRQVGAELGVGAVLEGSVRRAGDRLRITLQLIDATTEEHRWAETYDRELKDVFEIQADIAERTARALHVELVGPEREAVQRRPMRNVEAYDSFLRGVAAFQQAADTGWSRQGVELTAKYFDVARAKEPDSAAPVAWLANLLIAAMGESFTKEEVATRVRGLVDDASRLGPNDSEAHTVRGNFALQFERDWTRAEEEFRTAVALNPSEMSAHAWFGILLMSLGRFEEARKEIQAAEELDPLFRQLWYWHVRVAELAGDREGAVQYTREALARDPGDRNLHVWLGRLLLAQGDPDAARKEASLASGPMPGAARAVARAGLLAALGDPTEAQSLVANWERNSSAQYMRPLYVAELLVDLGRTEEALKLIEEDTLHGEQSLWIDFRNRSFDPIRTHPRFVAMLRRMNLPD